MADYRLPEIPYLRLRATFTAREPARLPGYLGSTLRGAFGRALRRLVCAMGPQQPCETCTLRGPCIHTRLFETFLEGPPPPFLKGLTTAPRPYVIEPAASVSEEPRRFAPGDPLSLDLLLFGQATELHGYAVLALEAMAEGGLGTRSARFALQEVRVQDAEGSWQPIGRGGEHPIRAAVPTVTIPPHPATARGPAPERLTLCFATPTRIRVQGELRRGLPFRPLAFAMLRRALELAHCHVPAAEPDWDFNGYLRHADQVEVTRSDLRWHDWTRHSSRQGRRHEMGGFVGHLHLRGDLAPFLPLLAAAEVLHVGKGTTFGLGKVEVE